MGCQAHGDARRCSLPLNPPSLHHAPHHPAQSPIRHGANRADEGAGIVDTTDKRLGRCEYDGVVVQPPTRTGRFRHILPVYLRGVSPTARPDWPSP